VTRDGGSALMHRPHPDDGVLREYAAFCCGEPMLSRSTKVVFRTTINAFFIIAAVSAAACGGAEGSSAVVRPLDGVAPAVAVRTSIQSRLAGPMASPSPVPSAAPLRWPIMTDTWSRIGLFQPFDFDISRSEATSTATRFDLTWGPVDPAPWLLGNRHLNVSYYLPFDTDADITGFGYLGHPLAWWRSPLGHPDWVLYRCDRVTPAWVGGLPVNAPLDISNPDVVAYQMRLVVPYIEAHGYNALAADVISLHNGSGGCGVWTRNHTVWVPKFSGQRSDPAWTAAVQYWAAYAQWYLHAQHPQLALLVNSSIAYAPEGDPDSEQFVDHVDAVQDEGGFTNWGGRVADDREFRQKEWWMTYVQSVGKPYMIADLWPRGGPTAPQREFAIATYLLGRGDYAALFTSQYGEYGEEHYYPEYADRVGGPCAAMVQTQGAYERKLETALVIVNTSTSTIDFRLPKPASFYTDMERQPVSNPMPVDGQSGLVLLTADGCD
jgi:hypothetical protein